MLHRQLCIELRVKPLQIKDYKDKYRVDHHVTTGEDSGEGAFVSETAPDVVKVVVDKGSERGYVEIAGGGLEAFFIRTSPEQSGFSVAELQNGQICMINGRSTVVYNRPR